MENLEEQEECFRYKGVKIEGSHIGLLKAPCPLPRSIFDFFFTYLSDTYFNGAGAEDAVCVPPFVSTHVSSFPNATQEVEATLKPFNLRDKNLIIFRVVDIGGDYGVVTLNHVSLLVYWRKFNVFVHHDSMQGVNSWAAERLFNAVKGFVVVDDDDDSSTERNSTNKSRKGGSRQRRSKRSNCSSSNSKKKEKKKNSKSSAVPRLVEADTPQQINHCDCGIYVMAIARAICEWHVSDSRDKGDYWFLAVEKSVNPSIESTMRPEILQLIRDLSTSPRA